MKKMSLALSVIFAIAAAAAAPAPAKGVECTRASGDSGRLGPALASPIKLTPDRAGETLNFGSTRGTRDRDILVTADKPLPASITPDQIVLDLPRRFERAGEEYETAYLDRPTFTEPVISASRREISFSLCVNADGAKAGSYVGALRIGGPEGLERAVVQVTSNVRAKYWVFSLGLLAALAIAIGLLIFRRVKDNDKTVDREFLFQSIIPLGAATIAMIIVYANDPAWGAEPVPAFIALGGTALGAAGLKSLLDANAGRKS